MKVTVTHNGPKASGSMRAIFQTISEATRAIPSHGRLTLDGRTHITHEGSRATRPTKPVGVSARATQLGAFRLAEIRALVHVDQAAHFRRGNAWCTWFRSRHVAAAHH